MSEAKARASYLSVVEQFALFDACRIVCAAYWETGKLYQVGSSLTRPDYRDVDLRMMVSDEEFAVMFGGEAEYPLRLQMLNAAISTWLAKRTGLNIDFQFQSMTQGNQHDGRRNYMHTALRYDRGEW